MANVKSLHCLGQTNRGLKGSCNIMKPWKLKSLEANNAYCETIK